LNEEQKAYLTKKIKQPTSKQEEPQEEPEKEES